MFDDEKDNQNWDDINPASYDENSAEAMSWDDILSDENVANLNSEKADDDFAVDFSDEDAAINRIDSYAQEDSEGQYYNQANGADNYSDEPNIETTSISEDNQNVDNLYSEDYSQGEGADIVNLEQDEPIEDEIPNLESQSEIPSDEKPIGIREDNSKNLKPIIYGVLAAAIIGVLLGGIYMNFFKKDSDTTVSELQNPTEEVSRENFEENTENTQGIGANIEESGEAQEEDKKVTVDVVNTGRSNPFTPVGAFSEAGYTIPGGLDIMPVPTLKEDMPPNKLVEIVVSGILYDGIKPSAIITVGGVDHFVQRGDAVDEYVVSYIGPNSVTIRSGRNSYTASIGQEFNVGDRIEGQTTYIKTKHGTTRQYFSPSAVEIESKEENKNE